MTAALVNDNHSLNR